MNTYEKCSAAAEYIKTQFDATDAVGLVLGSGLGNLAEEIDDPVSVSYRDIPYFPTPTVAGHAGTLISGTIHGVKVLCMNGRFHFYEGHPMETVAMGVRVMKLLGCRCVILTNAAGGCNVNFTPGTLMVIDDFINFMGDNPLYGENDERFGPRFPDMTLALSKEYRDLAFDLGKELGINIQRGTYMAFRGPNYETPAEIRFAQTIGADAVGMSTVPEILAARHCGLPVLGISCITNMAAGITGKELNHLEVTEIANKVNAQFRQLLVEIIKNI